MFVSITPCRLLDTRPATPVGARDTPIGSGETIVQAVTGSNGNCNVPSDARAVAMNVTSLNGGAASYLTIWPSDASRPTTSNLNWVPGAPPTPNKVDVRLSVDGKLDFFNSAGSVDIVVDVFGYYADHNFDDRYDTKAQVDAIVAAAAPHIHSDTYGPDSLVVPTFSTTSSNGCTAVAAVAYAIAWVPLRIPVGARVTSVRCGNVRHH